MNYYITSHSVNISILSVHQFYSIIDQSKLILYIIRKKNSFSPIKCLYKFISCDFVQCDNLHAKTQANFADNLLQ